MSSEPNLTDVAMAVPAAGQLFHDLRDAAESFDTTDLNEADINRIVRRAKYHIRRIEAGMRGEHQDEGSHAAPHQLHPGQGGRRTRLLSFATSWGKFVMAGVAAGILILVGLLYEQTLAIRKAVYGERHPDTVACLINLAGTTPPPGLSTSRPWRSMFLLSKQKEGLGEKHPGYATDLTNLAELLRRRGTTPLPGPSTSGPWRSARRRWASATPTPPPA